eukprot:9303812-Prorocentrum_lima.AAC.1
MTSSLVGSEMCIRDSLGNDLQGCLWRARCCKYGMHAFLRRVPPSVTVSYTHLTLPTICSV